MRQLGNHSQYGRSHTYYGNRTYGRRINKKRMAIFIIIIAVGLIVLFACIRNTVNGNEQTVSQEQYAQLQAEVEDAKLKLADLVSKNESLKNGIGENNPLISVTDSIISELGNGINITLISPPSDSAQWEQYTSSEEELTQHLVDSYNGMDVTTITIKYVKKEDANEQMMYVEESFADGADAIIIVNNLISDADLSKFNEITPIYFVEI